MFLNENCQLSHIHLKHMSNSKDYTLEVEGRIENNKLQCYVNNINSIYCDDLKIKRDDIIGKSIFKIKDNFTNICYEIINCLSENTRRDSITIYAKKRNNTIEVVDLKDINDEEYDLWQVMAHSLKREANFINVFIVIKNIGEDLHNIKERKIIQDIKNYNDKIMSMSDIISNLSHAWRQPLNSLNFSILNLIDEIYAEKEDDNIVDEYYKEIWHIIKSLSRKIEKFKAFFEMNYKEEIFNIKTYLDLVFEIMEEKIKRDNLKLNINIEEEIKKYGSSNEFVQIMYCIIFDIVEHCKNTLDMHNRELNIHIYSDKDNVFINIKALYDTDKYKNYKLYLNRLSMFNNILQKKMKGSIDLINNKIENKIIITFPLNI